MERQKQRLLMRGAKEKALVKAVSSKAFSIKEERFRTRSHKKTGMHTGKETSSFDNLGAQEARGLQDTASLTSIKKDDNYRKFLSNKRAVTVRDTATGFENSRLQKPLYSYHQQGNTRTGKVNQKYTDIAKISNKTPEIKAASKTMQTERSWLDDPQGYQHRDKQPREDREKRVQRKYSGFAQTQGSWEVNQTLDFQFRTGQNSQQRREQTEKDHENSQQDIVRREHGQPDKPKHQTHKTHGRRPDQSRKHHNSHRISIKEVEHEVDYENLKKQKPRPEMEYNTGKQTGTLHQDTNRVYFKDQGHLGQHTSQGNQIRHFQRVNSANSQNFNPKWAKQDINQTQPANTDKLTADQVRFHKQFRSKQTLNNPKFQEKKYTFGRMLPSAISMKSSKPVLSRPKTQAYPLEGPDKDPDQEDGSERDDEGLVSNQSVKFTVHNLTHRQKESFNISDEKSHFSNFSDGSFSNRGFTYDIERIGQKKHLKHKSKVRRGQTQVVKTGSINEGHSVGKPRFENTQPKGGSIYGEDQGVSRFERFSLGKNPVLDARQIVNNQINIINYNGSTERDRQTFQINKLEVSDDHMDSYKYSKQSYERLDFLKFLENKFKCNIQESSNISIYVITYIWFLQSN